MYILTLNFLNQAFIICYYPEFLETWFHWNKSTFINDFITHYQKTDKYKRKYRGNISVGKFSRDFTDGHIPSVYTEGITEGQKN